MSAATTCRKDLPKECWWPNLNGKSMEWGKRWREEADGHSDGMTTIGEHFNNSALIGWSQHAIHQQARYTLCVTHCANGI